ncbi:hypothetical protein FPV67DRAFT_1649794 [Lyophyllum atratum]|nr:hypothetical protein FPV67DRAFT_1649794 [Lyophyllum atratum]
MALVVLVCWLSPVNSHLEFFKAAVHPRERGVSPGKKEREQKDRETKEKFLKGYLTEEERTRDASAREDEVADEARNEDALDPGPVTGFWEHDDGLEEISRVSKETCLNPLYLDLGSLEVAIRVFCYRSASTTVETPLFLVLSNVLQQSGFDMYHQKKRVDRRAGDL